MRVLILGGYGTFGGRLAQLLADEADLELVIAGRSFARAQAFCAGLKGACRRTPLALDRDGDLAAALREVGPDLVVDATGPFQTYGADPYRVVRAAIDQGADYLDLADSAGFVNGVGVHDAAARAAGVSVLSGVSSFPVLTAAVVRVLARDMAAVDEIHGGIAPSPHARVGLNVLRAITSYAGRPIRLKAGGKWGEGRGLAETLRYTIAPPGRVPLRPVLFSLVDVPDLEALPRLWPQVRTAWMGAGPTPEVLHRILIALARLVGAGLLPGLGRLAPLFHWVNGWLKWGEHRGGMFVRVRGRDLDGAPIERSWHLLAEGEDGPMIPSMAAEGLIRRALAGRRPTPGARACVEELELTDYDALFARRTIYTGFREAAGPSEPLYRQALGEAWLTLPPAIRAMHAVEDQLVAQGRAEVKRGPGVLAGLVARVIGAPGPGVDIPLTVTFHRRDGAETWTRDFGGQTFRSVQRLGSGGFEGLVTERFGLVTVGLAPVLTGDGLQLVVRRWTLAGVPLPLWMAPGGSAFETSESGVFRFDVEVRHPWLGRIVHYRGWLEPQVGSVSVDVG